MTKTEKWIYTGCFYAFAVSGMLTLMMGAIMPMLLTHFNLGYDGGGRLLSSHSIGNLASGLFSGLIAVHLGRKRSIIMLSLLFVLGYAGMLITKSPTILIFMFLLTGLGRGSISNINNTIVNEASNGSPGKLNLLHMFYAVGAFLAPLMTSYMVSRGLGWKFPVATVTFLGITMVLTFAAMRIDNSKKVQGKKDNKVKEVKKEDSVEKGEKAIGFYKNVDFYIAGGLLFFYLCVETSLNGWIVTYLQDTGIMSTSLAQTVLSIMWIIIIAGRLFCAYISQRFNTKNIILSSAIGSVIFFILFLISTNTWAIIVCVLGLGFCLAGVYPTTIANVGNIIKGSGLAMGVLLAIAGLGAIIMPYITGLVAEKSGITGGMVAISVAVVFMFVFALINKFKKPNTMTVNEM
jgi:fucose permease